MLWAGVKHRLMFMRELDKAQVDALERPVLKYVKEVSGVGVTMASELVHKPTVYGQEDQLDNDEMLGRAEWLKFGAAFFSDATQHRLLVARRDEFFARW